jgi:hypothetical protein
LRVQLDAPATLGLDTNRIRARLGPVPEAADALVPVQTYLNMWDEAERLYGLPSALALAIPFGALDYLVGSADTMAGCCESAMLRFAMVAIDLALEIDPLGDGVHALLVRDLVKMPVQALEFTLAARYSRLRDVSGGSFAPTLLGLPIPRPPSHCQIASQRLRPNPRRFRTRCAGRFRPRGSRTPKNSMSRSCSAARTA